MTTEEEVHYVTDRLYEDVWSFVRAVRGEAADAASNREAERVLFREARLLDGGLYEQWLDMLDPRCVYWVPGRAVIGDPRLEPSIHFDDHRRLSDRVALIRTGYQHAQLPPSRTVRLVSNVETWPVGAGLVDVESCVVIHEYRRGAHQEYVGRQLHRLAREASAWRIRYRVLLLIDRDGDQGNITFIL